jgi:hypothetical protein
MIHPELFTYRSASFSKVDGADDATKTTTSVDLYGTFNRNGVNLNPSNSLPVSNLLGNITPNNGLLGQDLIQFHGFIYSDSSAVITTDDFSKSLNIDGEEFFLNTVPIVGGKGQFTIGEKTFRIVQIETTNTANEFEDHATLDELLANTDYYAWSFIKYVFVNSNTFVSVSDNPVVFQAGPCTPVPDPIVAANQSFCGTAATVADLAPQTGVKWFDGSKNVVAPTVVLVNGTYYVTAVTPDNCTSDTLPVIVSVGVNLAAPTATTPQEFCEGAVVADLQATGVAVKWFDAETGGNELLPGQTLTNGAIYWVASTTANCNDSERTPVKAIVGKVIPSRPVIPSPQNLCGAPTLQDIIINTNDANSVNSFVWYDAETDGTELPLTTPLVDGQEYFYAVSGNGNQCQGATRYAVLINIVADKPNAPVLGSDHYTFCPGTALANIPVPNNQILWYLDEQGGDALDPETILIDGITYWAAQKAGDCESDSRTAVLISISDNNSEGPTVPAVQPPLCLGDKLSDLTITGARILWYTEENGGVQLNANTALVNGTTYWAAQSTGTCQSKRVAVEAIVITLTAPIVNTEQSFCDDATIANLSATVEAGSILKWYRTATAANSDSIPSATLLVDAQTNVFYAKAQLGECFSDVSDGVTATISGDMNAPTATTPQTFCSNATVANLQAIGVGIKWYTENGTLLADTDVLENGVIYYAAQSAGSCESLDRTAVKVVIDKDLVLPSPDIQPEQTLCTPATLANIAVPVEIANNVVWYASENSDVRLPLTTDITTGSYYAALTAGDCESAVRTKVDVILGVAKPGKVDPPITSPQSFCAGTTLASVVVPNNQIVWYSTGSSNIALDPATILTNKTYWAALKTGDGSDCETAKADRQKVVINVGAGTSTPIANSPQVFNCGGVVGDLQVTGSNVTWYTSLTGGTALSLAEPLITGTYYASQGIGSCQSITRAAVTVTVAAGLPAPTAQPRQSICNIDGATIADLKATGVATILWFESLTATQPLPSATALVEGVTYYAAQADGACISQARTAVTAYGGIEIVQKDNNILTINNNAATNGDFNFVFYVWKKNDNKVKEGAWGEGRGGYYIETNLNGTYIALLTDEDGGTYETCPLVINFTPAQGSISVYPNPLVSSQMVYVDADMDESVLETAHIEIFSPLGAYIGKVKAQRITPVRLPEEKGVYVLKFSSSEGDEFFKIIVK